MYESINIFVEKIFMSNNYSIQRMYNVIRFLKNKPSTMVEIQDYLSRLNSNYVRNEKTIRRDFQSIEELFGYEIEYDKSLKVYKIEKLIDDVYKDKLLESIALMNILQQSKNVNKYIHLEQKQTRGTEYLTDIIEAIENKQVLSFTLNSYWKEATKRKCAPIAIKEAMKRFYLIAYDLDKKAIRNYGLDRISSIRVLNEKFSPVDYDVDEIYQHAFGIENYGNPVNVVLRFDNTQFNYLTSLPLHHSQEIIKEEADTFTINLFVHPTHELKMEILKFGDNCEVLEPENYREQFKNTVNNLYRKYKKNL